MLQYRIRPFLLLVVVALLLSGSVTGADDDIAAAKGKLLLIGGRHQDLSQELRGAFFELAGGKDARIVVIPTAVAGADEPETRDEILRPWRELKPLSLEVLHTRDRKLADDPAFVKPLTGSRGDFAQALHGEAALVRYFDDVVKYYDAILIQPIVEGTEYRVFLLDDDVLYSARKYRPSVAGDGVHTVRELLAAHNDTLHARGLSPASLPNNDPSLDAVPAKGERREIPGRMNLSAGGTMVLAEAPSEKALALARQAARATGLRVAAIDMFVDIGGKPDTVEIIEVNSNPSIRLLEDSSRGDLILKIWHHTFSAMGML